MTVTPCSGQRAMRLVDMALDLGFRHAGIMFERQRGDRVAVLVAAADAGEAHDGADIGAAARQRRDLARDVEIVLLQRMVTGQLVTESWLSRRSSAGRTRSRARPRSRRRA